YRLRFEDGSHKHVTQDELSRYGSQVVADAEGTPQLDQTIRWIEVDVPARFLPEKVCICDTPGLGAMHAKHAEITHRFVPDADAVIFVVDSGQPIVQAETKFIDQLLSVTPSLFFVQ